MRSFFSETPNISFVRVLWPREGSDRTERDRKNIFHSRKFGTFGQNHIMFFCKIDSHFSFMTVENVNEKELGPEDVSIFKDLMLTSRHLFLYGT